VAKVEDSKPVKEDSVVDLNESEPNQQQDLKKDEPTTPVSGIEESKPAFLPRVASLHSQDADLYPTSQPTDSLATQRGEEKEHNDTEIDPDVADPERDDDDAKEI